jgi:hypothetical protein
MPYAQTDLVPLEGERWEVRIDESPEEELDVVLHAVARWAADHRLDAARVVVDGKRIELPSS